MTMTALRHLSEAHRLAARAEALADVRLGWAEPSAIRLFMVIVGRNQAEYVDGALYELYDIYVHTQETGGRR